MKFEIQHQRALIGNDIVVGVEAEGKEQISRVTTTLDGLTSMTMYWIRPASHMNTRTPVS